MNNAGKVVYNFAALFCSLDDATVQNLVLDESCSFTGNWAAALAVRINNTVTVRNVTSRATVVADNYAGGLVATASKCNGAKFVFEDCTNAGSVTADDAPAAGLLGNVTVHEASTASTSISVVNCANTGNVTSKTDAACGFVCARAQDLLELTVTNSINKGNISGKTAFGIAGLAKVKEASNIVSMGFVDGTEDTNSFWSAAHVVTSTFVLESTCQNCGGAEIFAQNPDDKLFYVTGTGSDRLNKRLNEVVAEKGFTMLWSETLDLVKSLPGSSSSVPSSSPSNIPSSMSNESNESSTSSDSNNDSIGARLNVVAPLVLFSILIFAF